MSFKIIGKGVNRKDAYGKVTGKAKYADDFFEKEMLCGKILSSPYAHARIRNIDVTEAEKLPGVLKVLTYKDLPYIKFATAGHPWALEAKYRDVADRLILTDKARFVGDSVAAVIAENELIASKALELIKVDYEVLPHVLDAEEALKEGAPIIHDERPNNLVSDFGNEYGDYENDFKNAEHIMEGIYETSIVQHCHLETQSAYSYKDIDDRLVIVSSTQIPHIVRRIVGQALGIPWGKIRVIKPYIGGGFGNKQEVIIEPLVAAMSLAVNGKPVKLTLSREECFVNTRTRHAIKFYIKTALSKDNKLQSIHIRGFSNTGAYASHGHSIIMSAISKFRPMYNFKSFKLEPKTVYTNLPVAGAMRAYGVPQIIFALESHIDDICRKLKLDPIEFRKDNLISLGHEDPISHVKVRSFGLPECIDRGKKFIKWDEKKKNYQNQKGDKRRGLGMACFSYFSGTYPVCLEVAGARIILNQDGSVQLQVGATEIGQGADTIFAQMVAEVLGIPLDMVHVISTQDTDITPFDTGAYASRQTYIAGAAVKKAALEVKEEILKYASQKIGVETINLDIEDAKIINKNSGTEICTLEDIALETFYDRVYSKPITSDTTVNIKTNAVAYGVTFAEVEVDMQTGVIEVLEIINVHDSGTIINHKQALGQVHGGVSMALGYALSEKLIFDEKTGKILNNNFLDYKLQTIMDTPKIDVDFVETYEETGSFGQKSLGENPAISPAPAIRNAVLDATGVYFNKIPMNPQTVFEKFKEMGLL